MLTGDDRASAEAGAAWAEELCNALGIPPLSAYGLRSQHVAALAEKAVASVSMKTNPVPLTREEIQDILLWAI